MRLLAPSDVATFLFNVSCYIQGGYGTKIGVARLTR
jgi:hypothetical protein